MEFIDEDCKSLLAQIKHQEKELKLKRRWLIGLRVSKYEQRQRKGSMFRNDRHIPESLLREDDVSYETIKTFVGKGAGGCNAESKYRMVEDEKQLFNSPKDIKVLFSLIDNMTNKGLCSFAEIVTGGSINFEKTRWKMKKIIKECLLEVVGKRRDTHHLNILENLTPLLKDPHNFRWNSVAHLTPESHSYHAAVINILDGLEDLPTRTLSAMHRKLRGIKGYTPRLQPQKSGWGRDTLIKRLRRSCMRFLSELGKGDEPQEPLAKAMEVVGLTLKLIQGSHYVTQFKQFSPEINVLQNDIAMSIWLLNHRVRFKELKNLQLLLDPNAELSNRSLRTAMKNLLTEYLFECSDMDTIPECLLEILAIIKKNSEAPYKHFSEKQIEEEVECILSVSAQTKQIVWDLIPEHEFDLEFADAYMEDLEESDDGDVCEDNEQEVEHSKNSWFHSGDSDEQVESIGEINLTNPDSPTVMEKESVRRQEPPHVSEVPTDFVSSNFSCAEKTLICDKLSTSRNQYLNIQAACDETGMVAYRLIGHLLDEFAQREGGELSVDDVSYLRGYDLIRKNCRVAKRELISSEEDWCSSVIIQAVEELIPSFPQGGKERLKELMGSNLLDN